VRERAGLRFDLLRGEDPPNRRKQRIPVQQLEVAAQLLDAVTGTPRRKAGARRA